jgi:hypothetical protein
VFLCAAVTAFGTEYPLRFQETERPDHPAFSLLFGSASRLRSKPRTLSGVPGDFSRNAVYLVVETGGSKRVAVANTTRGRLLIDMDMDNSLGNDQAVSGKAIECVTGFGRESAIAFGPITLPASSSGDGPEKSADVYVTVTRNGFTYLRPTGFYTADIELSGRKVAAAVIDANFDGLYDGILSPGAAPDVLIVDLNGDGNIDDFTSSSGETAPLGKLLHTRESYYAVQVAPDGSSIAIEEAKPEFGTLDAGLPEAVAALWSDCGFHSLKGSDGKLQAPAGFYQPFRLALEKRNRGGRWTLTAEDTGTLKGFDVEAGQTTSVKFGPPLTFKADARRSGQTVSLGITAFGQAGERYPVSANLNGKRQDAPAVQVTAEDGTRLASGRFKYG